MRSPTTVPSTLTAGPLGAHVVDGATTFVVWAPHQTSVDLVVETPFGEQDVRALSPADRGYWSGAFDDLQAGTLYRYRLNGSPGHTFPDPASRFQPLGVHGPSQVVDPSRYHWADNGWRIPTLHDLILYELHVGTFSPEGTFAGIRRRLPYLKDLGITAIELMPIADFPGSRNWGYDGAALYAPARCYGAPDSLRELVDAAHGCGIAVLLDAVYNHFGPSGAYANAFSPYYLSETERSPWGRAINFDGPHAAEVRRFFIDNAIHWIREYHIDGLRLDATHAIVDHGTPHILAELVSTVRARTSEDVLLIAEDHRNLTRLVQPPAAGGYGFDAVWADDLHHQLRVHTAGDRDGYYADYSGSMPDIAETLSTAWFFTGQHSRHLGTARGTDPAALDPPHSVICIQNHDQIGNRFDGARLHHEIEPAAYRALSALLLLAPHTPLLFMGQEWAAGTPFQFFTDHDLELGRLVSAGRRNEFASFLSFAEGVAAVPDPQAPETFSRSRLRWDELDTTPHRGVHRLYARLIDLRRTHPALQARTRDAVDVRALDGHRLTLRRVSADGRRVVFALFQLSGSQLPPLTLPEGATVAVTTEDADVVEAPLPPEFGPRRSTVRLLRPGAIVLSYSPANVDGVDG